MFTLFGIPTRILLLGCLLALSACAGAANKATYTVSGPQGVSAVIRYRIPGGEEKQDSVTLPWKQEVSYTSGQQLEIIADNTSRAGNITCSITLADQNTPVATNEGADQAACSVKP